MNRTRKRTGLFICIQVSENFNPDTYAFMENIRDFVQELDNSKPVIFHNSNTTFDPQSDKLSLDTPPMMIVSLGAVRKILSNRMVYINCVENMNRNADAGYIIQKCSGETGVEIENLPYIHAFDPSYSNTWNWKACAHPLAIRQISAASTNALCNPACKSNVNYEYLFQNTYFPPTLNFYRLGSGNETTVMSAVSLEECLNICDNMKTCKSWSFDGNGHCAISSSFGPAQKYSGALSGICKGRYTCQAVTEGKCNPAQKIVGNRKNDAMKNAIADRRNRMRLP